MNSGTWNIEVRAKVLDIDKGIYTYETDWDTKQTFNLVVTSDINASPEITLENCGNAIQMNVGTVISCEIQAYFDPDFDDTHSIELVSPSSVSWV